MKFQKGNKINLGRKHSETTKQKISEAHLGKKLSPETIKKIIESRKGYRHSEETKIKMSESHKGIISWNKGKKLSKEHKEKIGKSNKDKHNYWLGRKHSEETKRKISLGNKGKIVSKETRVKMSLNHANYNGENHPNWKGGITPEYHKIRGSDEYNNWRRKVFERDNYTCQLCGNNKSGTLRAHHVKFFSKYPELRFEVSNGLTVCKDCHESKGFHKGLKLTMAI